MEYEDVLRLELERGFFFPTAEIYSNTPGGFWDYGPLGLRLRDRFIDLWRKEVVRNDGMIEMDGALLMPKDVFTASGHLEGFVDPIVQCKRCKVVIRADKFISERTGIEVPERADVAEMNKLISEKGMRCPSCGGELGQVSKFNMMFNVPVGVGGEASYLRPETAQSIFVSFQRIFKVMRLKLPVGIAQFGKSFRNEIAPRQSLMRMREFHQAEVEVFFNPKNAGEQEKFARFQDTQLNIFDEGSVRALTCHDAIEKGVLPNRLVTYYLALIEMFYEAAGVHHSKIRFRRLRDDERAFYAQVAFDLEVETSLGWIELVACNYRTDFDLSRHANISKKDLAVMDGDEKVLPHIFELSMGVDRSLYVLLEHSYVREGERDVLRLRPYLSPVQVGVFPLVTKDGLAKYAQNLYGLLKVNYDCYYDESGSIGRRYRRADEVGVPVCLTVDYDTLKDNTVTMRDRDSMKQVRLNQDRNESFLNALLSGQNFEEVSKAHGVNQI